MLSTNELEHVEPFPYMFFMSIEKRIINSRPPRPLWIIESIAIGSVKRVHGTTRNNIRGVNQIWESFWLTPEI